MFISLLLWIAEEITLILTYVAKKNKAKNQNQDVIAQDGNRVVLTGQPENGDYINATRLNMEENYLNRTWIVTQGRGGN